MTETRPTIEAVADALREKRDERRYSAVVGHAAGMRSPPREPCSAGVPICKLPGTARSVVHAHRTLASPIAIAHERSGVPAARTERAGPGSAPAQADPSPSFTGEGTTTYAATYFEESTVRYSDAAVASGAPLRLDALQPAHRSG